MATVKKETAVAVTVPKIDLGTFKVTLVGDSPLIVNRWSEKAKKMMLDKQMGKPQQSKPKKDPRQDWENSFYHYPTGGYGFPVIAFKAAAVDACSHADGITKVEARGAFHIDGELTKIEGKPTPFNIDNSDTVRVGMGIADLRFRGKFPNWKTTLAVRYNKNVLTADQIVNLFNIAGFAIGVGEWRPQKDGQNGMFHVEGM